jgi:hypothetical protein
MSSWPRLLLVKNKTIDKAKSSAAVNVFFNNMPGDVQILRNV